jgi:hypothetical protein
MKDIVEIISEFIGSEWIETDPSTAVLRVTKDEFDPNDPVFQVLLENGPAKSVWITRDIYRVEHTCKVSVFIRPLNYLPSVITSSKVTFINSKVEVDRIFRDRFGVSGVYSVELQGWNDIGFETRGTGDEPIVFHAVQVIKCIYYEGEVE